MLKVNRLQDETEFQCAITSVDSLALMAEQGVYIQKVLALGYEGQVSQPQRTVYWHLVYINMY